MLRRRFLPLLANPLFGQELPAIRVEVNLVNLPFSARDEKGQLVRNLTKDEGNLHSGSLTRGLSLAHFGVLQTQARISFNTRAPPTPDSL